MKGTTPRSRLENLSVFGIVAAEFLLIEVAPDLSQLEAVDMLKLSSKEAITASGSSNLLVSLASLGVLEVLDKGFSTFCFDINFPFLIF